jgi:hypothetical protein
MRITLRRHAAIAAALALSTRVLSGQAASADREAAACGTTLSLVWIDGTGTPPAVLEAAEDETQRIWAAAGIAIVWAHPGGGRGIRAGDLLVALRVTLPAPAHALEPRRPRGVLGRVIRESDARPGRLIEVAVPAVLASLAGQSMFSRPLAELPGGVRDRAAGRALGRVIAHEIGHWLFGRGHATDGLMKPSIGRADLVSLVAPELPRDWPASAPARMHARRPCPA